MPTPTLGVLAQIGSAFGSYGLQQQEQQQREQFQNKSYIAQQALKMIDERAKAGDVQFLNDPNLTKHLKPFIGPQTLEAMLPFKQKEAEAVANEKQLTSNIMKFAATLGQTQQAGGQISPGAIPTLIGKGAEVGLKPSDLSSAGLTIKPPTPKIPGDLDARALARGYQSFKDAPTKVRAEIVAASDVAGKETPQEAAAKEAARKQADIDVEKRNQPAGTEAKPPEPGKLPPVMDFNQWKAQNPSITDPKQQASNFAKDQTAYKKAVVDLKTIETAKSRAAQIRDKILKYMDDNNIQGGGAITSAEYKLWGHAPNLAPKKYQQLYTMLSQLYAVAAPGYIGKGAPRSKAFLDQMTKHLPQATDNPDFMREQLNSLGPFLDSNEETNKQQVAQDFGIPYTPGENPAVDVKDALEKYKKPDGTYDTDAIARDPNLK